MRRLIALLIVSVSIAACGDTVVPPVNTDSGVVGDSSNGNSDGSTRTDAVVTADGSAIDASRSDGASPGTDSAVGRDSGGGADGATLADGAALDASVPSDAPPPMCPETCDDGNFCNGAEMCESGRCVAHNVPASGARCDIDSTPSTIDVCISGLCTPARCGDGVATGAEACDDGNGVDGDGCEQNCTFSCATDTDCDDEETCNGTETCNRTSHVCVAGTNLADGATCGTAGPTSLTCQAGSCEIACTTPEQCSDGDPCNGAEFCGRNGRCVAGVNLACDDTNACTSDACVPRVGCTYTLIDTDRDGIAPSSLGACGTDCDDSDGNVYPGAAEICDGKDSDCNPATTDMTSTWYVDCDGDTYASPGASTMMSCARPRSSPCAGTGTWTTRNPTGRVASDCNDANPNVRPNQRAFQSSAIAGAAPAEDFDYDCDDVEEARIPSDRGRCSLSVGGVSLCSFAAGWVADAAPTCGVGAEFITACRAVMRGPTTVCVSTRVDTVQTCR